MEVKGKAVWILNVLVDATYHNGETERADQNSGLTWRVRVGACRKVNEGGLVCLSIVLVLVCLGKHQFDPKTGFTTLTPPQLSSTCF